MKTHMAIFRISLIILIVSAYFSQTLAAEKCGHDTGKRLEGSAALYEFKNGDWRLDKALSQKYFTDSSGDETKLYRQKDGRIMMRLDGLGIIFRNFEHFIREYNRLYKPTDAKGTHVLQGAFSEGADFPRNSQRLYLEALSHFQISTAISDDEVLKTLQLRVDALKPCLGEDLYAKQFKHILIIIGHQIIKRSKGQWKMKYDSESKIWEPWIRLPAGDEIPVFTYLRKEIMEREVITLKEFVIFHSKPFTM